MKLKKIKPKSKKARVLIFCFAGLILYFFIQGLIGELSSNRMKTINRNFSDISLLITDCNNDGVSDINDIMFVDYDFTSAINLQPDRIGNKIVVFFRSNSSSYITRSSSSISGPYYDNKYIDGVLTAYHNDTFINSCVQGATIADDPSECRYLVYIYDSIEVYSDDKAYYYYVEGDEGNKLMIRRSYVRIYDISTGELIAKNVFSGSRKTRNAIKRENFSAADPRAINIFLSEIFQ